MTDVTRGENRSHVNDSLLPTRDAARNVHDFISQNDKSQLLDKSYGDGSSPNEICAFKLDQGKIDELANDYRAKTRCVSFSCESAIQNVPYEETVKNDGASPRNEDKSRCKSTRKRKICSKIPDGVIIDLTNDACGVSRSGVRINVVSVHNLTSKKKFVAISKYELFLKF